jgi:hypothetical protein
MERALERMHNLFASMDELAAYHDLEKVIEDEVLIMPHNMQQSFLRRSDNRTVKEKKQLYHTIITIEFLYQNEVF